MKPRAGGERGREKGVFLILREMIGPGRGSVVSSEARWHSEGVTPPEGRREQERGGGTDLWW